MVGAVGQRVAVEPRSVEVGLLGPVIVIVGGVDRPVTAPRQRAVLAWLAMHAGEPVSADRLLEAVWGDQLPAGRARAVAFQISKLRSALEPDRVGEGALISTSTAGYIFNVERDDVDAHRFARLVGQARDALITDSAGCLSLTAEALRLWRGHPFADLAGEPFVDDERRSLERVHLLAQRTRSEALLADGRHVEVIGDLESMIIEHPLDEALAGLLMTALQRSGRPSDALRVFGELRVRLSSELGIEPSNEMRGLEQKLLAGHIDAASESPLHRGPASAPDRRAPIPAALTSFWGRTADVAAISEMLSSTRVVTLCGFGGLGKTRLARETAMTLVDRFGDGVWFVDLTSIDEPKLLVEAFLVAGGVATTWDRDPVDRLKEHLADLELLIVVDNCEHLADDVAAFVSRIVEAAPDVRVLATSRVGLGIAGEGIQPIHPLDVKSGLELFVDRARLVRSGYAVEGPFRADVGRLVERLDGIPLAIEMAAARMAVMSVEQITALLDDRFGLLAAPGGGGDERQRSLEAVMDWSYELLGDPERIMLRRLSVCVGGFTLDAALQIGVPAGDDSTVADVLDRLGRLVEASLVEFDEPGGEPRYRMLETVRAYAADRLDQHGPDEAFAAGFSHARYYASVATKVGDLQLQDHDRWLRLGDRELGNLHVAIDWAYRHGELRLGLSMARSLWGYQGTRGLPRPYLRTAVELINDDSPEVLEAAALSLIEDHEHVIDLEFEGFASGVVERGLETTDDPALRSVLLRGLAEHHGLSDPRAADRLLIAAAELVSVPPIVTLDAINNRIVNSWETGRVSREAETLRQIDEIVARHPPLSARAVSVRAVIAASAGRWDDVLLIADDADGLDGVDEYPIALSSAEALIGLGRHAEAIVALDRSELSGNKRELLAYTPITRASVHLAHGDPTSAVAALDRAVDVVRRDPRRPAIGVRLASMLAVAANELGLQESAAVLFGHSIAEQERLDIRLREFERPSARRAIEACRAVLGVDRFDRLAGRGATMAFADLPVVE